MQWLGVSVCLFVCLSVTNRFSIEIAEFESIGIEDTLGLSYSLLYYREFGYPPK